MCTEASETDGIAKIVKDDGSHVGMAVVVDKDHALTCAHVINQARDKPNYFKEPPAKDLSFQIRFPSKMQKAMGYVVKWGLTDPEGEVDLAVLKLADSNPADISRAVFSFSDATGLQWKVFGQHQAETQPYWTTEAGSSVSSSWPGDDRIQLDAVGVAGRWIDNGDSGATVWCTRLRAAIGVVATKHRDIAESRISAMIPAGALRKFWPLKRRDTPRRRIFDRLIADHPYFGGRCDVLERIDALLDTRPKGYIVVEAESGFGKTALMVQLAAKSGHETVYHFFTNEYGSGTGSFSDRGTFLANLYEQLAEEFGDKPIVGPIADHELGEGIVRLLARPAPEGRKVVVLIDGADEADFSLRPILGKLGDGVHVVISARRMAGKRWAEELPPLGEVADAVTLPPIAEPGIADLLRVAGGGAGRSLAEDPWFRAELTALTRGDPFFLALLMRDFRGGSDADARQAVSRLRAGTPRVSGDGHAGLRAYLDAWWDQVALRLDHPGTRALVGYLAVARAPLSRNDLIAIDPGSGLDPFTVDGVLKRLGRFLLGDDVSGYRYNHDRFREHVRAKIGPGLLDQAERQLIDFAGAYAARDDGNNAYSFAALTAHLSDSAERLCSADRLVALIQDGAFLRRKARFFRRYQPALADVELALHLVTTLHGDPRSDADAGARLREQAIVLAIAEEALHERIERRAGAGGILASAIAGDFDGAIAEATTLPDDRDRVIQLALIAETAAKGGPEHYPMARQSMAELTSLLLRNYVPLSSNEEGQLADFVATSPPELRDDVRACAAGVIRRDNMSEVDIAILWEQAASGVPVNVSQLPDLTWQAKAILSEHNATSPFLECARSSRPFRDALLRIAALAPGWDEFQTHLGRLPEGLKELPFVRSALELQGFARRSDEVPALLRELREHWREHLRTTSSVADKWGSYGHLRRQLADPSTDYSEVWGESDGNFPRFADAARDVIRIEIVARVSPSDPDWAEGVTSKIAFPLLRGIAMTHIVAARRSRGLNVGAAVHECARLLRESRYPDWQPWVWGGNLLHYLPAAVARLGDGLGPKERGDIIGCHWDSHESAYHVALVRSFRLGPCPDTAKIISSFEWSLNKAASQSREDSDTGWDSLSECLSLLGAAGVERFLEMLEGLREHDKLGGRHYFVRCVKAVAPHLDARGISRVMDAAERVTKTWHRLACMAALDLNQPLTAMRCASRASEVFPNLMNGLFSEWWWYDTDASILDVALATKADEDEFRRWRDVVEQVWSMSHREGTSDYSIRIAMQVILLADALGLAERRALALEALDARLVEALKDEIDLTGPAEYANWIATIKSPLQFRLRILLHLLMCSRSRRLILSRYGGSRNRLVQSIAALADAHLQEAGLGVTDAARRLDAALDGATV